MHTIELAADIDQNHQIHLQLPETVKAGKAKVILMVEDEAMPHKPFKFGLFAGKIQISDDFDAPLPDSFWLEGQIFVMEILKVFALEVEFSMEC